ncbi:MAG: GNAT family N-acetyltransferase [Actinobacteria bacterium]|uniref:Unannotated protein n=1 Tax=freshwater metagenome TaxID=449393 RepID=A0A6J7S3C9_9ZZZZ|nr:GNAT family N-acetyltransferase [Actinomycetota bacterium]
MAVARRLGPLTRDSLAEIPGPCGSCVRWEFDAVHRARVERDGIGAEAKADWLSSTLLDWGSCGQVVRVDGVVAGYALYAPPAYLPGLAAYATAPVSADAVALSTMRVAAEYAGRGIARMLIQGMAADLVRRGVRAVEAITTTHPADVPGDAGGCLIPADFLLAVGFNTIRAHPRTPRVRLDLRTTLTWREDVVEAAMERLLGRRQQVGALPLQAPTE